MPRSRSRSPRTRRDNSQERRHRSRRHDEEPEKKYRSRRDEGRRDRDRDRDRESGRSSREKGDRERGDREKSYRRDKSHDGGKEGPKLDERLARRDKGSKPTPAAEPPLGASATEPAEPPVEKEKVNFANTGLLAAATNTVNGVVLKYSEPSEARKPPAHQRWRLFVFKDKEIISTLDLNTSSCWLVGRDRAVADLPVDHPSCSKQHAVLQFRFVTKVGEFGDKEAGVRPYIIDLESANGTWVNKLRIPETRYLELKEGDLIVFGLSTRFVCPYLE